MSEERDEDDCADEELILARWGSEDALLDHLMRVVGELCPAICGETAEVPVVEVRPSSLSRGHFGEHHAAAEYEPAAREWPSRIILFPSVVFDKATVRTAIAHELVHHWESLGAHGAESLRLPSDTEAVLSQRFGQPDRIRRWRSGHSDRFIAKAAIVSAQLGLPFGQILNYRPGAAR